MNQPNNSSSPNREDRLMAALAYPFWFVVFPLIYMTPDKRKDPFLRFHSYQAAILGFCGVAGLSLLRTVLSTLVRWFILFDVLLYPILKMAEWGVLLCVIYGGLSAFFGKKAEIPFLSSFVRSLSEPEAPAVENTPEES